jgi:hypothetical protein
MKPYKIIHGSNENINAFEDEVSTSLEEGYEFASRLLTKVVTDAKGISKVLFFQPMVFEEILDAMYDETDDDVNDEEDDDE